MEGNLSGANLLSGAYGMLDLHGSLQSNQHQSQQQQHHVHSLQQHHQHDFSMASRTLMAHETDNLVGAGRPPRSYTSDDDEPSINEDEPGKVKKNSPWQRVKWTDDMVRLLVSIVAYIGEDTHSPESGRRKLLLLQKKGKWKSVSRVMATRGYFVSPQQCEDKFNDLNKRYKRLTDLLGRGTSCKVVENPALLDSITHLSEKAKEDVRKALNSKHLYYEEMCSYHNGNRLHLLNDTTLLQCLQSVLKGSDERDLGRMAGNDQAEDDMCEDDEEGDDNISLPSAKRMILHHNLEEDNSWLPGPSNSEEHGRRVFLESQLVGMNEMMQGQWIRQRLVQLEEQNLSIQSEALELENQWFKWQRFSKKKEREFDRLKLENEKMKLENEGMLLELKKKELEIERKLLDPSRCSGQVSMESVQRREQNGMEGVAISDQFVKLGS